MKFLVGQFFVESMDGEFIGLTVEELLLGGLVFTSFVLALCKSTFDLVLQLLSYSLVLTTLYVTKHLRNKHSVYIYFSRGQTRMLPQLHWKVLFSKTEACVYLGDLHSVVVSFRKID